MSTTAEGSTHDTHRLCASLLRANLLRASGVKMEVAMAILGHKNAAMLLNVYAGAFSEEHANAAAQLQRYLYGAVGE